MNEENKKNQEPDAQWEPMTLTYVGDAGQLLEGGGGKMSPVPHDTGDIFKPPGQN